MVLVGQLGRLQGVASLDRSPHWQRGRVLQQWFSNASICQLLLDIDRSLGNHRWNGLLDLPPMHLVSSVVNCEALVRATRRAHHHIVQ